MTGTPLYFSRLLSDVPDQCRALDDYVHKHIPLTQGMQAHTSGLDARGLTLSAPLAVNHNHQGSAFGGSLASLAMLAGWGLLWLLLDQGSGMNIVVRDMHMDFQRPVNGVLEATCAWPDTSAWEKFTSTLERYRKARLELRIEMLSDAVVCGRCTGVFAARRGTASHD